jgi:hypothetical protein
MHIPVIIELIGWIIIFSLFSFPVWINGNWKTIFDKDLHKYYKYLKNEKKLQKMQKTKYHKKCTQYQPFRIDEKTYIICNFNCGNCQFKRNETL